MMLPLLGLGCRQARSTLVRMWWRRGFTGTILRTALLFSDRASVHKTYLASTEGWKKTLFTVLQINEPGSGLSCRDVKALPCCRFKGMLDWPALIGKLGAVQGSFPPHQENIGVNTFGFSFTLRERTLQRSCVFLTDLTETRVMDICVDSVA